MPLLTLGPPNSPPTRLPCSQWTNHLILVYLLPSRIGSGPSKPGFFTWSLWSKRTNALERSSRQRRPVLLNLRPLKPNSHNNSPSLALALRPQSGNRLLLLLLLNPLPLLLPIRQLL